MQSSIRKILVLGLLILALLTSTACLIEGELPNILPIQPPAQSKTGHWEGSNPFVAFDVTEEGKIANFVINAPFSSTTCRITIEQITFSDDEFLVDGKTMNQQTASIGVFTIQGKFSGASVTGTVKVEMCGRTISFNPTDLPWRAARVSETPAPTSSAAVLPTKANPTLPAPTVPAPTLAVPTQPAPTPTTVKAAATQVYLGDLTPTSTKVGWGKYSVGKFTFTSEEPEDNIHAGDPIAFHGVQYPHGIFAHAPSRLAFDLSSYNFTELTATLGMVEHIACGDGAIFIVQVDGVEVYRSKLMFSMSQPVEMTAPVKGGKELVLKVDMGELMDFECDWAIWGDPILR